MDDPWESMLVAPPAAASSHISDGDLLASNRPGYAKHLADCAWCRQRLDTARSSPISEADDEEFEQALRAGRWLDEFAQVSGDIVLPDQVRAAMSAPEVVSDVEPGQLWRLAWRGYHLVVAVIEVAGWQVLTAPVTTDVGLADEFTLLVEAADSPFLTDLAIWVRCRAAVPLFVFDRPVGTLGSVGYARVSGRSVLQQLAVAHLTGSPAPGDVPVGRPLMENEVDRLAMHDALREQNDWFTSAAAGLIDSDGALIPGHEPIDVRQGPARPIPDLLRGAGLDLTELARRSGLQMGRLLDLARGAAANPEETAAVEKTTGGVARAGDDDHTRAVTALAEVSRPTWRAPRQDWTRDHGDGADAENPIPLVLRLLEQPVAARSICHASEIADDEQLHRYWRDRLALILDEYR